MIVGEVAEGVEVLVLGGGPAGCAAALRAARLGKDVTLITPVGPGNLRLSGDAAAVRCVNEGVLSRSDTAPDCLEARAQLLDRCRKASRREEAEAERVLREAGIRIVRGEARCFSPKRIAVENPTGGFYDFDALVIATGTRPSPHPALPLGSKVVPLSHAPQLTELPERIALVGEDDRLLELAAAAARLGLHVDLITEAPLVPVDMESEIAGPCGSGLRRAGVRLWLQTRVIQSTDSGNGVRLTLSPHEVLSTDLVVVGTTPHADLNNLNATACGLDSDRYLRVDTAMRTAARHIFAAGDVTGPPFGPEWARHEGNVAAEALCGRPAALDATVAPRTLLLRTHVAAVGLTEAAARAAGYAVTVENTPFVPPDETNAESDPRGWVKVVADARSSRLLGCHLFGPGAAEVAGEAALAIEMGALLDDVALTLHPSHTLASVLAETARAMSMSHHPPDTGHSSQRDTTD